MKAICVYRGEFFVGTTIVAANETPEEAKKRLLLETFEDEIDDDDMCKYDYFFIVPAVAEKLNIDADYSGLDKESYGRSMQMITVCRAFEIEG